MTARPIRRDGVSDDVLPVTASAAVADLLTGPPRTATVLASFPAAAYLDAGDALLALVTRDGIHQPHACVLPQSTSDQPLRQVMVGRRFRLGHGLLTGPLQLRVARWWNPVPALARTDPASLDSAAQELLERVGAHELASLGSELARALAAGRAGPASDLADRLLGWGPGLTPAGDDVLAGVMAAARLLPRAIGRSAPRALDALGDHIVSRSAGRTTRLSMSLLDHARRGEVAAPAAAVLRALVGRGELAAATDDLLRVGATSGHDLALGVALGARATAHARPERIR